MIEWLPAARLEMVKVAFPLLKTELPSVEVPSRNVTFPVAEEGETVAVKVTAWPDVDGLRLESSAVVVLLFEPVPTAACTAAKALTRP